MSKVLTDQIEKRTGGTAIDLPTSGKWPTANIADDAITADKLANSINTDIAANTAKVTNATHTGDVTGATALTIATDAVDIAMLSATGTADSTTFLRGDNAWASAGGDNTPAFQAYLSGSQSLAYDTGTKVTFDTEDFDTDGAYDNSTNYRFTVPAGEGGKYFVYYKCLIEGPGNSSHIKSYSYVQVNGSNYFWMAMDFSSNYGKQAAYTNSGIVTLAAADYVECTAYIESTPTSASSIKGYARAALFGAYKLIGL